MGLIYDTLGTFVAWGMFGLAIIFGMALRPLWQRVHVKAWMASFGVIALGLALFVLPAREGTAAGIALLAFRNGLLLLGAGYQVWGWGRLLGRAWSWPVAWIPMIVLTVCYLSWGSTYPRRVLIVDLAMASTALAHLLVIRGRIPATFARVGGTVRLVLAGHMTFCVVRGALAWLQLGSESLYRWTAYAFLEFFGVFALLAYLEWVWADQWEEELARESAPPS